MIYRTENDNVNGRMSFVFSCLFTVPIIIGRGLGLFSISQNGLNAVYDIFNFYNNISISRTIEIISWTTFFPLSILFLARIFNKSKERADKILAGLCMLSSVCCFIGFMTIISSNTVYLWFGLTGWGVLFVLIIIFYIYSHILKNKADHTS
jgi:hypothetical protein